MSLSKQYLSGSSYGQSIAVGTTDTDIHAAPVSGKDQVTLVVSNVSANAVELTLKEGTTTVLVKSIAAKNGEEVVYNAVIGNSLAIKAVAGSASALFIRGNVIRES
jgi:hypothetical protein